jgi:hypothetical protein
MAFKSVFDRNFKYRNASSTDVGKTFKRVKQEQRRKQSQVTDDKAHAEILKGRDSTRRRKARQSVR